MPIISLILDTLFPGWAVAVIIIGISVIMVVIAVLSFRKLRTPCLQPPHIPHGRMYYWSSPSKKLAQYKFPKCSILKPLIICSFSKQLDFWMYLRFLTFICVCFYP